MDRHFFKVNSAVDVGLILAKEIKSKLEAGPVFWLVSGGSAIDVSIVCANQLADADLSSLTITLADERFGPPGHKDSNWQQLMAKGLSAPGAKLKPFLNGEPLETVKHELDQFFSARLDQPSYKIALLGMGSDGHTAGILPHSPAVLSDELVVNYQADDYKRLTLSLKALNKLDEAVLYAAGPSKAGQLQTLAKSSIDPKEQPAQIIKVLPRWTVYNDRIGEAV
ncbi:MAG TPA: 6-phosphogluconolactonase [Candidatus Saccharimonadales bacterium]|nr:6-phosphogluconolactonase [Candidatus Saccharimonadales bacterium]